MTNVVHPALFYAACILVLAVTLSGCTTTRLVETPLASRIPAGLLVCRDRPVPGALDRQSDVARYVVDLDTAGEDCRGKVQAVRGIVEGDKVE